MHCTLGVSVRKKMLSPHLMHTRTATQTAHTDRTYREQGTEGSCRDKLHNTGQKLVDCAPEDEHDGGEA